MVRAFSEDLYWEHYERALLGALDFMGALMGSVQSFRAGEGNDILIHVLCED